MRIEVVRQVETLHRQLVALVGQHLLGRDDPGLDDALVVIEVAEEHVQRTYALDAALFDLAPFARRDAARDGIEGDQALGTLIVAIQGEGDARAMEQQVRLASALLQLLGRRGGQPAGEGSIVCPAIAPDVVHLIVSAANHARGLPVCASCHG
ncbi:hypothetical protein D3C80_769910 [compost metagenome]